MRLSWNEIRSRAANFVHEWADEGYEKGQTQLFYRDLFEVFGVPIRRVASFEEPVKRLGAKRGFIDLFWKGVLLVEQKSLGRNLVPAKEQALSYFPGLKDAELPRYILLSDFQTFELYDLDEDDRVSFALADLPANVEKLGFILGIQKRSFKDQDPVNIEAAELVGRLHDALEASGYRGHDLERFLVRIVFCLFADDTGIFEPRDIFLDWLENRTREDGSDLGSLLAQLFQVLDTPEAERSTHLDADMARFPYVNGALFSESLRIPSFDSAMRERLLEACRFDWSGISPAIFGSLFQSVMDAGERRAAGAHYTTEKNIQKVIGPLFMDDLRAEFARATSLKRGRRQALTALQDRMAATQFFDPACGCGNFLIIAYRELRLLEIDVIRAIRQIDGIDQQQQLDAAELSHLNVDQFHGIEIGEFPARIAETAMWMMDHLMNNRLSLEFGQTYARIPLRREAHIVNGDALETDWADVIAPERCDIVLGNPPFVGAKYQTDLQRQQIRDLAKLGKSGGTLDFVSGWFIKAAEFAAAGKARVGLVSTNSITQGEQVAQLWPQIFQRGMQISFAHRTFAWGSDARGKAHVHVVIVGMERTDSAPQEKRLFFYDSVNAEPHEQAVRAISPYLFDASSLPNPQIVVAEAPRPLNEMPRIVIGSKPIDGGHYIFDREEMEQFLTIEPGAADLFRPYVGAREFLQGGERFILYVGTVPAQRLVNLRHVRDVIARVRDYRLGNIPAKGKPSSRIKTPGQSSLALAETPREFHVTVVPDKPFMILPKVSSERRNYMPIGWAETPTLPSDLVFVASDATLSDFAILTSAMHMAWLRFIGGRLESRYRYSIGLVYNTFPLPQAWATTASSLTPFAQAVLDARAAHPDTTLATLYDPDLMPTDLRRAHTRLDRAVDRLYAPAGFVSEDARIAHLLGLYDRLVQPLTAASKKGRKAAGSKGKPVAK